MIEALTFRLQADSVHGFGLGMQTFGFPQDRLTFPAKREGVAEWKAKNGDCVQDRFKEALFPECSGCLLFQQVIMECKEMC